MEESKEYKVNRFTTEYTSKLRGIIILKEQRENETKNLIRKNYDITREN